MPPKPQREKPRRGYKPYTPGNHSAGPPVARGFAGSGAYTGFQGYKGGARGTPSARGTEKMDSDDTTKRFLAKIDESIAQGFVKGIQKVFKAVASKAPDNVAPNLAARASTSNNTSTESELRAKALASLPPLDNNFIRAERAESPDSVAVTEPGSREGSPNNVVSVEAAASAEAGVPVVTEHGQDCVCATCVAARESAMTD